MDAALRALFLEPFASGEPFEERVTGLPEGAVLTARLRLLVHAEWYSQAAFKQACRAGHEGVLCAGCMAGYTRSAARLCEPFDADEGLVALGAVLLSIGTLLFSALLGVAINQDYSSPFEMCWAFSIYLEAVAILPQLFMLQKQGGSENLTSHYIFMLGMYRLFYLFNWIYRYATEENYMQVIVWVSGAPFARDALHA